MFINNFNSEPVSLDDAQFVLALALEEMCGEDVFEGVVSYLGRGISTKEDVIEEIIRKRKIFHEEVKSYGIGNLQGCIQYFYKNPVIKVKASNNSKNYKQVSLEDILTKDDVKSLYSSCMNLLRLYPGRNLLLKYMSTSHCKRAIMAQWRKEYAKSADKSRQNVLSSAVMESIYSEFYTSVGKYNLEGWNSGYGTPLRYVRHCLNFFKGDDVYKILNDSGFNVAISLNAEGDEVNSLTYRSISKSSVPKDFNFLETVKSIYKASVTMFNHNGSDEAYYDIFSFYCDRICEEKYTALKSKLRKVYHNYNFTYRDNLTFHQGDQIAVIKTKKTNRCSLCRVFLPIVENGINPDEIMKYYKKVLEAEDANRSSTSGIHLFKTSNNKASNKLTNSELLQIMISGFLALKDLLFYLNSDNSICTPFEFPTTIFRDPAYIRRFNNIQDYVNYFKQVSDLVEEARCDSVKSSDKSKDGLFSNDRMYDVLVANNYIHNSLINHIMNVPLNNLGGIIDKNSAATKSSVFNDAVYDSMKSFAIVDSFLCKVPDSAGFIAYLSECSNLCTPVVKYSQAIQYRPQFISQVTSFYHYFSLLTKGFGVNITDGPIVFETNDTKYEFFEWCKKMLYACNVTDVDKQKQYVTLFMQFNFAFVVIYNVLMGTDLKVLTNEQFVYLIATLEVLERLMLRVKESYNELEEYAKPVVGSKHDTTYLAIAVLYKYSDIFMMREDGMDFEIYMKDYLRVNVINSKYELVYEKFKLYIKAMIRVCLEAFGSKFDNIRIMYKIARSYISERHEHVSEYSQVSEILTKASNERRDYFTISSGNVNRAEVLKSLHDMFTFDSEGYALQCYERYTVDGKYVLDSGYLIEPSEIMDSYTCIEIDENTINGIKYDAIIRG